MSFRINGTGNNDYLYASAPKNDAVAPKAEEKGTIIKAKATDKVPELEPKKLDRFELAPEFAGLNGIPSQRYLSMPVTLGDPDVILKMADVLQDDNDALPPIKTEEGLPDLMNFMLDFMA